MCRLRLSAKLLREVTESLSDFGMGVKESVKENCDDSFLVDAISMNFLHSKCRSKFTSLTIIKLIKSHINFADNFSRQPLSSIQ